MLGDRAPFCDRRVTSGETVIVKHKQKVHGVKTKRLHTAWREHLMSSNKQQLGAGWKVAKDPACTEWENPAVECEYNVPTHGVKKRSPGLNSN